MSNEKGKPESSHGGQRNDAEYRIGYDPALAERLLQEDEHLYNYVCQLPERRAEVMQLFGLFKEEEDMRFLVDKLDRMTKEGWFRYSKTPQGDDIFEAAYRRPWSTLEKVTLMMEAREKVVRAKGKFFAVPKARTCILNDPDMLFYLIELMPKKTIKYSELLHVMGGEPSEWALDVILGDFKHKKMIRQKRSGSYTACELSVVRRYFISCKTFTNLHEKLLGEGIFRKMFPPLDEKARRLFTEDVLLHNFIRQLPDGKIELSLLIRLGPERKAVLEQVVRMKKKKMALLIGDVKNPVVQATIDSPFGLSFGFDLDKEIEDDVE